MTKKDKNNGAALFDREPWFKEVGNDFENMDKHSKLCGYIITRLH